MLKLIYNQKEEGDVEHEGGKEGRRKGEGSMKKGRRKGEGSMEETERELKQF